MKLDRTSVHFDWLVHWLVEFRKEAPSGAIAVLFATRLTSGRYSVGLNLQQIRQVSSRSTDDPRELGGTRKILIETHRKATPFTQIDQYR